MSALGRYENWPEPTQISAEEKGKGKKSDCGERGQHIMTKGYVMSAEAREINGEDSLISFFTLRFRIAADGRL